MNRLLVFMSFCLLGICVIDGIQIKDLQEDVVYLKKIQEEEYAYGVCGATRYGIKPGMLLARVNMRGLGTESPLIHEKNDTSFYVNYRGETVVLKITTEIFAADSTEARMP